MAWEWRCHVFLRVYSCLHQFYIEWNSFFFIPTLKIRIVNWKMIYCCNHSVFMFDLSMRFKVLVILQSFPCKIKEDNRSPCYLYIFIILSAWSCDKERSAVLLYSMDHQCLHAVSFAIDIFCLYNSLQTDLYYTLQFAMVNKCSELTYILLFSILEGKCWFTKFSRHLVGFQTK